MGALLAMKRGGSKLTNMLEPSARLNVYRDEVRLRWGLRTARLCPFRTGLAAAPPHWALGSCCCRPCR